MVRVGLESSCFNSQVQGLQVFATTPVLSYLMFMEFLERIYVVDVNGWLKLKGLKVTPELRVSEPDVVSGPTQRQWFWIPKNS